MRRDNQDISSTKNLQARGSEIVEHVTSGTFFLVASFVIWINRDSFVNKECVISRTCNERKYDYYYQK